MPDLTLKRDGSWAVELNTPLKHRGQIIDTIIVHPTNFEQVVRWGRREIPSQLALLAELTNLPERLLRMLVYPDSDRVLIAMMGVLPNSIAMDLREGKILLATPDEFLPPVDTLEGQVADQDDPRFPHVPGVIQKFPEGGPQFKAQPPKAVPADKPPVDTNLADIMKPVQANG